MVYINLPAAMRARYGFAAMAAIEGFAAIEASEGFAAAAAIDTAVEYDVGGSDIDIGGALVVVAGEAEMVSNLILLRNDSTLIQIINNNLKLNTAKISNSYRFISDSLFIQSLRQTCACAEGAEEGAKGVAVHWLALVRLPHHRADRDGRLGHGGQGGGGGRAGRHGSVPWTRFAAGGEVDPLSGSNPYFKSLYMSIGTLNSFFVTDCHTHATY